MRSRHRSVPPLAVAALAATAWVACARSGPQWPTRPELIELVSAASQTETDALRAEVVRLAARSDAPELESVIAAAAVDDSPLVRGAALEAELRRGDRQAVDRELLERLANGSDGARRTALDLVLRYGDEALKAEIVERSLRHSNADFRAYALRRVIMDRGAQLVVSRETMTRALDGDDPAVAAEVLERLGASDGGAGLHRIHQRLTSDDDGERLAALRVLTTARSLDAWPLLRWVSTHGATAEERTLATLGLARIGQQDAREPALDVIRSGDSGLTHLALRALAGQDSEATSSQLRTHREDTRPEVRAAALHSTLALGRPPAEILPFVDDPEPAIADRAALELLRANQDALIGAVCPDLLLSTDQQPLLQLLWRLWTDRGSLALAEACRSQLETLMRSERPAVRGLAARLYFQVAGPSPAAAVTYRHDPWVLYALVDASLERDGATFREVYRELVGHALVAVRAAAAIGLLETTP